MNKQNSAEDLMKQGIAAIKAGDRERAWNVLVQSLKLDQKNQEAWLWISHAAKDEDEQRKCLERAKAIDPHSELGQQATRRLQALTPSQAAPAVAIAPPTPVTSRDTPASPPPPQVIKASGNTALLSIIALLLALIVANDAYNLYLQYEHRQRSAAILDIVEREQDIIMDYMEDYKEDAYDNPNIERISVQQLIATEYTLEALQMIAYQNGQIIELLAESP
jgi:hypothetical protein